MTAERQLRLDSLLEGDEPKLVQPGGRAKSMFSPSAERSRET